MKKGGRVFQPAASSPSSPAARRHAAYFTEPRQGRSRLPLSPPQAVCLGGKGSPGRCIRKPRREQGPSQYQARDERTTKDLRKQFVPARPFQPYRPRPDQGARPTVPTTPLPSRTPDDVADSGPRARLYRSEDPPLPLEPSPMAGPRWTSRRHRNPQACGNAGHPRWGHDRPQRHTPCVACPPSTQRTSIPERLTSNSVSNITPANARWLGG
jgi:hypothetical protein